MSRHKFMVINLHDIKVPAIMLGVAAICFTGFLMFSGDADAGEVAEVFSPSTMYEDGTYLANLAFSDANMNLVVTIEDETIVSVSLEGFDEAERALYSDINSSIDFVNDYVVATQSIELNDTDNVAVSTSILMDAVGVALSSEPDAILSTTYKPSMIEVPLLSEIE
ncbi:MAG: hypothetical protein BEN19_03325 [Epulopiscium sp. Nuni2H_MBin003]|nr:MAG: hypothetical protein BEN19_03325 [Epulopiscium sp. Nuni2H_MBin003]